MDDSTSTTRKSNIELLRIISMFLIILFHFSDWGNLINIHNISLSNTILGIFLNSFGTIGINIFVIISGYFLINSKFKVKKLIKLMLEVIFYSISIVLILKIFNIVKISDDTFIRSFFPISNNVYWFATAYIGLYILTPFINKFLKSLDKKQYQLILFVLLIMKSLIPFLTFNVYKEFDGLTWFILLYMIGAYLKIYDIKYLENNKRNICITIIGIILLFIINLICWVFNIPLFLNKNYSLPLLIIALLIFKIFLNINIKDNKIINIFARSSFAVYLIHMNTRFAS